MKEVSYTHHTLDDLFFFHSQHCGITSRQMHFITFFSFLLTLAGLRCVRCLVYGEVDSSVFFSSLVLIHRSIPRDDLYKVLDTVNKMKKGHRPPDAQSRSSQVKKDEKNRTEHNTAIYEPWLRCFRFLWSFDVVFFSLSYSLLQKRTLLEKEIKRGIGKELTKPYDLAGVIVVGWSL